MLKSDLVETDKHSTSKSFTRPLGTSNKQQTKEHIYEIRENFG